MNEEKMTYHGAHHRFAIIEDVGPAGGTCFVVRDADWVTDAEVRLGRRSPIVRIFPTIHQAKAWCDKVEVGKIHAYPLTSEYRDWPELKERVEEYYQRRVEEYHRRRNST